MKHEHEHEHGHEHEHEHEHDVIVIGAGFAGITAARDLSQAGKDVLVLEARHRVGGRTWYETGRVRGFDVEMGGGWLGDGERYAMAEVERYGIPLLYDEGAPARLLWRSPAGIREGQLPVPFAQLADVERALFALDSAAQRVAGIDLDDAKAVAALHDLEIPLPRLFDELDLRSETLGVLEGFWSGITSASWNEFSALSAARLIATTGGTFMDYMGTVMLGPRFRDGTSSLLQAMIADSDARTELGEPVRRIAQNGTQVTVTTERRTHTARAVVCTVPINALSGIDFEPSLSDTKRALIARGQAGRGFKLWVVVRGCEGGLFSMGSPGPFHHFFSLDERDGETLLVGFGSGPAPDITDLAGIERLVREYLPEAEVVACDLHDWLQDEFSRGTWLVQSAGDITTYDAEMRRPEGRIHFAGSDFSKEHPGYIDGAIESGATAAAHLLD